MGNTEPGARSDEQLFSDHVSGDPEAFGELFRRFAPQIVRVLQHRGLAQADAQDLAQQTLLRAHQARHDFREGASLKPWLWTIAFNLMRDRFRSQRAARDRERKMVAAAAVAADGESAGPEVKRAVRAAIVELPEGQREVVLLHWFQGMSFAEIGETLGASESAVKVRAHRAYKALRALLNRDEGGAS